MQADLVFIDKFALLLMGSLVSFFLVLFAGMIGWYLRSINTSLKELSHKFEAISSRLGEVEGGFVNWPACRGIQSEMKRRLEKLESYRGGG